jgi:AcrR family transcriptional regulator
VARERAIALSHARRQGPDAYSRLLAQLEELSAAKVTVLQAPGQVLLKLAATGFGVRLPGLDGASRIRAPPREHARLVLLPAPRPARVTERHGITALTLEAAAEEAGLTKPGLMYHFRTRDDLLMGIQRYLTEAWEEQLLAELGKPLEQSTAHERAAAYARVNAQGPASKAELAFMVESATSSELAQVWNDLMARWVPQPPVPDPAQLDLFLARLAADGLWLSEATRPAPLAPPRARKP